MPVINTTDCRYGKFSFYAEDEYVGKSLELYGEYSEGEVEMFKKILRPTDIVIEVGANIGALTVPLANLCAMVYAFEPHPDNVRLLNANIYGNGLSEKVEILSTALGSRVGKTHLPRFDQLGHHNYGRLETGNGDISVPLSVLDNQVHPNEKIRLIKIDVEGNELEVLKGAEQLIDRCRPFIYVENDRQEKSADLVGWLIDHNYRCYWHRTPLYHKDNFKASSRNVFGDTIALNMICFPKERDVKVDKLEEADDHRIDNQMYVREIKRARDRIAKDPNDAEAYALAAHYLNMNGEHLVAREFLDEAIQRNPNFVGSHAIKALMDLQDGNYKDGWAGYELRYLQPNPQTFGFRNHDAPHWDGSPTDEVVLIWHEQGFGDSIMFGRFMDEVLKRAPNAILEVQPQLFELFETSRIVPKGQLFRTMRTMPKYAYHSSLPSLPAVLQLYDEKQLVRGKYLHADPAMIESWLKRSTPRIGICLKGGVASERAYSRDMPKEFGTRLADQFGPFMTLEHQGQWESYADTAAAIEALDIVLTVDTSVAHLSGALGKRTILMLSSDPDWRWRRGQSTTCWYPTMKIFRQEKFMDWSTVVEAVETELASFLTKKVA